MEVEVSSAMLAPFYETTLCNNAEDDNLCSIICLHLSMNWYPWTVSIQSTRSHQVCPVFRHTLLSVTVSKCNSYHCLWHW